MSRPIPPHRLHQISVDLESTGLASGGEPYRALVQLARELARQAAAEAFRQADPAVACGRSDSAVSQAPPDGDGCQDGGSQPAM